MMKGELRKREGQSKNDERYQKDTFMTEEPQELGQCKG